MEHYKTTTTTTTTHAITLVNILAQLTELIVQLVSPLSLRVCVCVNQDGVSETYVETCDLLSYTDTHP